MCLLWMTRGSHFRIIIMANEKILRRPDADLGGRLGRKSSGGGKKEVLPVKVEPRAPLITCHEVTDSRFHSGEILGDVLMCFL